VDFIRTIIDACAPFVPMLFQGEEWAASSPFQYFTAHEGGQLEASVVDNTDLKFSTAMKLDGTRVASAQPERTPQ